MSDDTDECVMSGHTFGTLESHDGYKMCVVCGHVDREHYWTNQTDDEYEAMQQDLGKSAPFNLNG